MIRELKIWIKDKLTNKIIFRRYMEDTPLDSVEEMVANKHITQLQYYVYMMFYTNHYGREWVRQKKEELFMEAIDPIEMRERLPYLEGQRSVFKEIQSIINYINEEKNVRSNSTKR